jgi:hypothetical protein
MLMSLTRFEPCEVEASIQRIQAWKATGPDAYAEMQELLPSPEGPRDMKMVARFFERQLAPGDYVLFGAGSHTSALLRILENCDGIRVLNVLDSHARGEETFEGHSVVGLNDLDRFDATVRFLLSHHNSEEDMHKALVTRGVSDERIVPIYTNPDYIKFAQEPFVGQLLNEIDDLYRAGRIETVDHVIICSGGEPWTLVSDDELAKIFSPQRTLKLYCGREDRFWQSALYPTLSVCQDQSAVGDVLCALKPSTVYIQTSMQFFTHQLVLLARNALPSCYLVAEIYDWFTTFNDGGLEEMYALSEESISQHRKVEMLITHVADRIIGKSGGEVWNRYTKEFSTRYDIYYPALSNRPHQCKQRASRSGTLDTVFAGSLSAWRKGQTICSENACNDNTVLLKTLARHPGISVTVYNSGHRDQGADPQYSYYQDLFTKIGITYKRRLSYEDLVKRLQDADFGLVLTSESNPETFPYDNALTTLPNRFMGYVEAGVPAVVNACLGICAELLETYGAGISVAWSDMDRLDEIVAAADPGSMAKGMEKMRTDMVLHNRELLEDLAHMVREGPIQNK